MEKVIFSILYKNGKEDVFEQLLDTEEKTKGILELIEVAKKSMRSDDSSVITIGDGEGYGVMIRMSEVSRIQTNFIECDSK